jgi:hypothetical protein
LITVGDDLNTIAQFIAPGASYSAADVVKNLLDRSAIAMRQKTPISSRSWLKPGLQETQNI